MPLATFATTRSADDRQPSPSVVLVDAGGTNIGSMRYALQRLGVQAPLTSDPETIRSAGKVILPGVGAAAPAMARLRASGLVELLRGLTQPVLGVCLGMQLLCAHSEEGGVDCLGVIPACVRRLQPAPGLRVPHMGWNRLRACAAHPLLEGLDDDAQAYFVHSYAVPVGDATLAVAEHGSAFSAVIARGNFQGMQFHPERSAAVGARLLHNFLAL
ncbi:imidazole glycerol phosphate synthase subunit HisH [Frateuria sp. STR12]|uniref:imidazole glycerol phosphate synthase subunit HisH n=1 Tax=Frateuria hangzhouensis TaxID=2995589 RepID=UPI0022609C3A|nr:imidazole glycerol phosphate synthase subunit HisH [Frateuria sp. STR12]MCX7512364.1 imidazole glycerol phosphate synthase subunit HisH [Frateuria sp. STR12]